MVDVVGMVVFLVMVDMVVRGRMAVVVVMVMMIIVVFVVVVVSVMTGVIRR